jgi:hypothetical protein
MARVRVVQLICGLVVISVVAAADGAAAAAATAGLLPWTAPSAQPLPWEGRQDDLPGLLKVQVRRIQWR